MLQSDCDAGLSIVKDSLDVATEYGLQEFYTLQFFPLMNHSRGKKKKSAFYHFNFALWQTAASTHLRNLYPSQPPT